MEAAPPIPAKRYFTIGEVSELCGVKPHVLRYWEQEFTQLRPVKRRGNRRYYQHHEVLMIRRIRDLLYEQGFTISGARNKLHELSHPTRSRSPEAPASTASALPPQTAASRLSPAEPLAALAQGRPPETPAIPQPVTSRELLSELRAIRQMLAV